MRAAAIEATLAMALATICLLCGYYLGQTSMQTPAEPATDGTQQTYQPATREPSVCRCGTRGPIHG